MITMNGVTSEMFKKQYFFDYYLFVRQVKFLTFIFFIKFNLYFKLNKSTFFY